MFLNICVYFFLYLIHSFLCKGVKGRMDTEMWMPSASLMFDGVRVHEPVKVLTEI